jgi:hypothetical protein
MTEQVPVVAKCRTLIEIEETVEMPVEERYRSIQTDELEKATA